MNKGKERKQGRGMQVIEGGGERGGGRRGGGGE